MPGTPEKRFPGAWPESPVRALRVLWPATYISQTVMDLQPHPLHEIRPSSPSCSSGTATRPAKKPPPLRIIVPPTEYCPFSTDLTLPITPLSLPTPVSSSCFTFSDMQEPADQSMAVPPAPTVVLPSCPRVIALAESASPTSSQFLLIPPTPRLRSAGSETAIYAPSLTTSDAPRGSDGTKSGNLRPWDVSSSTWLNDLGGRTETDRIFRRNLLEITSFDTESSPVSTPALTPSAVSPCSQASSVLAYSSPTSPKPLVSSLPVLSPHPCTMSPRSSLARLILKPMGTDTFPSTLDSLQAWRESVTPGLPRSEESRSFIEDVHRPPPPGELTPETPIYPYLPSDQPHSHLIPARVSRVSRSQTFIKHARMFGGRVKRLVARKSGNKHRASMDRGVDFRVVTSQDSENGSVILVTAPPPPYDVRPPPLVSHNTTVQEYVRPRTSSEYSSAIQTSTGTIEPVTTGLTASGSRQGSGNRNALRRLSFAALSTIKRF